MSAAIRPAGVFDTRYEQDIALNRTRGDRALSLGGFLLLLLLPLISSAGPFGFSIFPAPLARHHQQHRHFDHRSARPESPHRLLRADYFRTGSLHGSRWLYECVARKSITGLSFWLAVPIAALFTGCVGILFGLPALRVKGFYLAMATLAAQFIIIWLISFPLEGVTNGTRALTSIPPPTLGPTLREPLALPVVGPLDLQYIVQHGPITFTSAAEMYYIIVPLSVFMMLAARNIMRTRSGRAFISIRDNDLAAELLGINVFSYKLQAFFLCSVYAGGGWRADGV